MKRDLHLGADTGGTAIKYVVMDGGRRRVAEGEVRTDPESPEKSLASLAAAVASRLDGSLSGLAAVGLACAGIVDPDTGRLGRSPNLLGWQDSDLFGYTAAAFGDLPVALANDVNAALYGEFVHGAGRGCRHLVMIALGTGVGGGLIIDGRLLEGVHHGAGEIGHMVLDPGGPPCACGGHGCLEAWAGSTALLRAAREMVSAGTATPAFAHLIRGRGAALTTRDLAETAADGDRTARDLFGEAGRRLGQAVGNLVNLLDPDRVIIGGGVARAGDLIMGPCRETAPGLILAEAARSVPILPAELGAGAAALGAAFLAQEKLRGG